MGRYTASMIDGVAGLALGGRAPLNPIVPTRGKQHLTQSEFVQHHVEERVSGAVSELQLSSERNSSVANLEGDSTNCQCADIPANRESDEAVATSLGAEPASENNVATTQAAQPFDMRVDSIDARTRDLRALRYLAIAMDSMRPNIISMLAACGIELGDPRLIKAVAQIAAAKIRREEPPLLADPEVGLTS